VDDGAAIDDECAGRAVKADRQNLVADGQCPAANNYSGGAGAQADARLQSRHDDRTAVVMIVVPAANIFVVVNGLPLPKLLFPPTTHVPVPFLINAAPPWAMVLNAARHVPPLPVPRFKTRSRPLLLSTTPEPVSSPAVD